MDTLKTETLPRIFNSVGKKSFLQNTVIFCRILRGLSINVTTGSVLDLFRSMKHIDIAMKDDFYHTLRANLISHCEEIPVFDMAFQLFWKFPEGINKVENDEGDNSCDELEEMIKKELFIKEWFSEKQEMESDKEKTIEYSSVETLSTKDFRFMTDEEIPKIKEAIVQIVAKLATKKSRRRKLDPKGDKISLRHTLRMNLRHSGEFIELPRSKRKIKKIKLIALADVSGSMDYYNKFFIQFMYALQGRFPGVETFVFSTHLARITNLLKRRSLESALKEISKTVHHWSGGTRIGSCLETFSKEFASTVLNRKSIVMIISDGWDRGDTDLLEYEIKKMKENCHQIIWLNPLLGSDNYQPLCKGIQAVLPHVSHFLPLHNLKSLVDLGKTLKSVI